MKCFPNCIHYCLCLKELEHIARQAEEAANDARNTEVAVSVHVPAQASTP